MKQFALPRDSMVRPLSSTCECPPSQPSRGFFLRLSSVIFLCGLIWAQTSEGQDSVNNATQIILNQAGSTQAVGTKTPLTQESSTQLVPSGLIKLGSSHYNPYAIIVDKKARKLSVWKQGEDLALEKVIDFPSDIGKINGNKSKLGDHRTPEGIYFIQNMFEGLGLPFDKYGKRAFTLDYPNLFDQREGKTGSGIWIHAIPETETLERGSRGCVVVRNDAILELSKFITLGNKTPVLIFDQVPMHDVAETKKQNALMESVLARWLQSWSTENIDSYMKFYSESFYSLKMNKDLWRNYKTGLSQKYSDIQVDLYSPLVLKHKDGFIVKALQSYRSSLHEDFGEKILYFEDTSDGPKIIAEQWSSLDSPANIQHLAKCCTNNSQARN